VPAAGLKLGHVRLFLHDRDQN